MPKISAFNPKGMVTYLSLCCDRRPLGEVDDDGETVVGLCSGCRGNAVFEKVEEGHGA